MHQEAGRGVAQPSPGLGQGWATSGGEGDPPTTEIATGQHGWSIHRVGEHFEARQLLAKDKPETRHIGALASVADYANERGAGIQVCTVEERGGYALQYRTAPHRTWRVVDSEGRNVTGYEHPNEAQARDVLEARGRNSRND
jgi:hypothetical protein